MAKLYFRYGAMGSAKTLNLLAAAHSYRQQGKKVLILKPELDNRFGNLKVKSRSGLEKDADILIGPDTQLTLDHLSHLNGILVDEAQFLTPTFIEHLQQIARDFDIPVICYGLRTDFRTQLFAGSKRLLELADEIDEIKSTCQYCNKKAIFNMKLVDGKASLDGPNIQLGAEESYVPACASCYEDRVRGMKSSKSRRAVEESEAVVATI
ncbi:MAG: thymidine kinase [Bacteriovoracaceae bacterium]|nr:thymidine kinase [Bacteriovoracaceae bacterium]